MKKVRIECDRCHKVITKDLDENSNDLAENYQKIMKLIFGEKDKKADEPQGFAHMELYSFLTKKYVKQYYFCQNCYDVLAAALNEEAVINNKQFKNAPKGTPIYLIDDHHNSYIGIIKEIDKDHWTVDECIAGDMEKFYTANMIDWAIINDDVMSQRKYPVKELYEKAIEAMKKYAEENDKHETKE